MKKIRAILLYLLLSIFIFIPIKASTSEVTMLVTNPAEDMSSQINISYHASVSDTVIEYTLASDPGFTNKTVIKPTCKAEQFKNLKGEEHNYERCTATIKGLNEDSEYIYRVGKNVFTEAKKFKTAGSGSFSFLHVTDIHSYDPIPGRVDTANAVITKAKELDPNLAFTLASGDVVAYGSYYNQWINLLKMPALDMPLASTPGNHDYYDVNTAGSVVTTNASFYNKIMYNPENGASLDPNATHYFVYNNTLFISIDSESMAASKTSLAAQQEWFKEVVENNPSTFIVVYTHRPFYTANGLNAGQASTMRQGWQKIFDAYGVDLVLAGHNHAYARTKQTHASFDASKTALGTIYITGIQLGDRYATDEGTAMSAVEVGYIGRIDGGNLITVHEDHIDLTFFNTKGDVLDSHTIYDKDNKINKNKIINGLNFTRSFTKPQEVTFEIEAQTIGLVKSLKVVDKLGHVYLDLNYPSEVKYIIDDFNTKIANYDIFVKIEYRDGTKEEKEFNFDNQAYNYGSFHDIKVNLAGAYLHWDARLQNDIVKLIKIYINGYLVAEISDLNIQSLDLSEYSQFTKNNGWFVVYNQNNKQIYDEDFSFGVDDIWGFLFDNTIDQFESLIYYLKGD